MNYIELDVNNLTRWFTGAIGTSGKSAENVTGYAVYFSDRRGEATDPTVARKTGAYGYNDNVNRTDAANGCPDGKLDTGEDYAQTGLLVNYANTPHPLRSADNVGHRHLCPSTLNSNLHRSFHWSASWPTPRTRAARR